MLALLYTYGVEMVDWTLSHVCLPVLYPTPNNIGWTGKKDWTEDEKAVDVCFRKVNEPVGKQASEQV